MPAHASQVALLREVGCDAAFNYHTTPKEQALKDAAPDGNDIYWCGHLHSTREQSCACYCPGLLQCHIDR
jgi:hypothetical protein